MATDKSDDPKKAVETKEPVEDTEEKEVKEDEKKPEDKVEPEKEEKEAKPAAEKPETEETGREEDSDPDHLVTPPPKEGSSVKGLIIVIIIAVVIVFGTGGFLAWKYLFKDKSSKKADSSGKVTTSDTSTSPTASSTTTTPPAATSAAGTGTGTSSSTDTTKSPITGDYVIADSNTRVLSRAELTSLTPWQLKVARNEIYARHGREFVHKDLQCYFTAKSWYKVNPAFSETDLSTTENQNIATVQAYEKEISSSLASQDSGC